MPEFGWTRLAYSLLVLAALAAIVQIGSPSAATKSQVPEPPGKATAAVWPVDGTESDGAAGTPPREGDTRAGLAARHENASDEESAVPEAPRTTGAPVAAAARETAPPVFYRPSPEIPSPGGARGAGAGPVCGDLRGFSSDSEILFPLSKAYFDSYEDTWGAPRPQGGHEGTDLMAPTGTPEYAVTDGTIVPVAGSNENGWNSLGGYAVMLEAAYSVGPIRKGDLFYYAHLRRASDLEIGARVQAGQVLGYAGDTGQGPEATSGLFPPHLHFGWYDTTGARSDLDSGAMNPFPLLDWMEANGGALRGGSDARYCEAPQTGTPRPSAGGDRWPVPKDPGVRPDLSAGSPEPSPTARKDAHEHGTRERPAARATENGPARDVGRNPQGRGGEPGKPGRPETEKGEPPHREPPSPAPRAGKAPSPDRPGPPADNEKNGKDGKGDGPTRPPFGNDEPKDGDEDPSPGRPDEKKDGGAKGEDRTPKGRPEKDPGGDKGRGEAPRPPEKPPDKEPPPADPDAEIPDEEEAAETTTAEDGEEQGPEESEPGDPEPEDLEPEDAKPEDLEPEQPSPETTTATPESTAGGG
jgi:murein DD-endopeptidase MepM/ murein hydrolase activator NlpD